MNVFWVCFVMTRVQNAHAVQRLWPNCWPGRRVHTVHATLKNYRKYMQHGTSRNKNKQWEIPLVFSYIVIKEIKDKKLWFQLTTCNFDILSRFLYKIYSRLCLLAYNSGTTAHMAKR